MKNFNTYAICAFGFLAAFVLAGCGGKQSNLFQQFSPSLQNGTSASRHAGGSWIDGATSSHELLYVSSPDKGAVFVYRYPDGKLVGTLTGLYNPLGECVDAAGDVFVVTQGSTPSSGSNVYEYAHGGSSPLQILSEPGYAEGCAIDPKTGDLAVANIDDFNNPYYNAGDVAIYRSAQGNPTMYYTSEFAGFGTCGYDDAGNLYLEALTAGSNQHVALARLYYGSKTLAAISLNKNVYLGYEFVPSVQWDGSHITISTVPETEGPKGSGLLSIYQLDVNGSSATVIGTTNLKYKKNRHRGQTWINGKIVVGIDDWKGSNISTWSYPHGGKPQATFKSKEPVLWGVAMSPSQTR